MTASFIENISIADKVNKCVTGTAKADFYKQPESLLKVARIILLRLIFINTQIFLKKSPWPVNYKLRTVVFDVFLI